MTPYASDELVLIVPRRHELADRRAIEVEELYALSLVSLNQVGLGFGSCQAATLPAVLLQVKCPCVGRDACGLLLAWLRTLTYGS